MERVLSKCDNVGCFGIYYECTQFIVFQTGGNGGGA